MKPYFTNAFGNASTLYSLGREAKNAMEAARQEVASIIGADTKEIIFTSGGTESVSYTHLDVYKRQKLPWN